MTRGLTRRRFLRAAGVGTAGAMVAAGAAAGQAGAEVVGAAVPGAAAQQIPARRKVARSNFSGLVPPPPPLRPVGRLRSTPSRRSATWTRGPTAAARSRPSATTGEIFIFDFGDPDYFAGGFPNEVPPGAKAITCNLTVTGGTSGGNLRAFPGNSDVIPLVANVNWTTGQTVGNYAIVSAATPADGAFQATVALHNASTRGGVHVIVDISGYFI